MTGTGKPLGGSFVLATQPAPHRLVVAIDGLEKQGKSKFALTAPGPIAYQNLDIGTEGVIETVQAEKVIWLAEYGITTEKGDDQHTLMAKAIPEWEKFAADFKQVVIPGLKAGVIKTVVWDTATEVWELLRLARLGKLTQVMPHNYVALNSEFQSLVRQVYDTPGNMVLLHKLKAQWVDSPSGKGTKTGNYERAGFSGTGFLTQVNATVWRERTADDGPLSGPSGPFHLTVRDARQNPMLAGLDLVDGMANFPTLGSFVYPDTDIESWT
jgi:AAA domain